MIQSNISSSKLSVELQSYTTISMWAPDVHLLGEDSKIISLSNKGGHIPVSDCGHISSKQYYPKNNPKLALDVEKK